MIRRGLGWAVACVIACSCSSTPPQLDGGGGGGSATGGGSMTAGGQGGAGGGSAAGGTGSDGGCTTACDCAAGFSCFNDQCLAGTVAVYCCSSGLCPPGDFCQQPSGPFEQCPKADGGSGLDGGPKFDGGRPDGGRLDGGAIDGGCATACDCPPGQSCLTKACRPSPIPVFCCGDAICPPPSTCQNPSGTFGNCGGSDGGGPFDGGRGDGGMKMCTTACDCSPGLMCATGRCIAGFAPVYCCGGAVCPMGNQCQSMAGTYGTCP